MLPPLARQHRLEPHPEGGFFRETFRSPRVVETPRGPRAASTAILFLLRPGELSRWHRVLGGDEVWHLYQGAATLHVLHDDALRAVSLTPDAPQAVVPAGAWQTTRNTGAQPALFGCTVAPGFDFADFALIDADDLAALAPRVAAGIRAAVAR